jgi:hypothetical protein
VWPRAERTDGGAGAHSLATSHNSAQCTRITRKPSRLSKVDQQVEVKFKRVVFLLGFVLQLGLKLQTSQPCRTMCNDGIVLGIARRLAVVQEAYMDCYPGCYSTTTNNARLPVGEARSTRVRYRPPDHPEQPLQLIKHNSCTPIGSDRHRCRVQGLGLSEGGLYPYPPAIRLGSWVLGCTSVIFRGTGGAPSLFAAD